MPTGNPLDLPAPRPGHVYSEQLIMGDRFRLRGRVVGPVQSVDDCVDGSVHIRVAGRLVGTLAECVQVELVSAGSRCPCGRPWEYCERECEWPAEVEALFMGDVPPDVPFED